MKFTKSLGKREFWADALKALAILLVVILHSSAKAIYAFESISQLAWNFANLLNSISRISVPLFIMISGAFVLNKKEDINQFIKKRFPRILLPWFFWGTIQLLYNYGFSINKIIAENFYLKIYSTYFGGFWFMPIILGLYLITPIIKEYVQKTKTKDYLYFFSIWFIFASLIPTLNKLFGVNIAYNLPPFIQYLGYYIAGYYITHKIKIKKEILNQTKFLFIISIFVIALGTAALSKLDGQFNETMYDYLNIPVLVSSIAGFISIKSLLENMKLKLSKDFRYKVSKISNASFGIFLSHALILDILTKGKLGFTIHGTIISPLIAVPLTILMVFSISAVIILLLSKYMKRLVT